METLTFQQDLRPALPNVYGTLDYRLFRDALFKMDEMLNKSSFEKDIITQVLNQRAEEQEIEPANSFTSKKTGYQYKQLRHALRCNIARHLTGESYRQFSLRLSDSQLFQWFTYIHALSGRKATSKSALERYEKQFDIAKINAHIRGWLSEFSDENKANEIGLKQKINFTKVFIDTTCIKAAIHFPVDWVLLRDAARSLLLAIKTIRAQGLKHRMIKPSRLLKEMNKHCINMTHTRRKKDGKKCRKAILREMKKCVKRIRKHAERYRELLCNNRTKTSWSEANAQQVIDRIDNILEQLPQAVKQAHDRIIGDRQTNSSEKILSLYDKEAAVIVRGKAGNEVEFGQRLLLAEQEDGLIIDWKLFSKRAPHDSKLLEPSINRINTYFDKTHSVSTDRGFSSSKNDAFLKSQNIVNGVCPKNPTLLKERLTDPVFISLQTRRSQTEARIGIFKNVFLGKPLRSQIMVNKQHAVTWCVLTHNLWVLSRKALADEQSLLKKAA